MNKRSLYWIAAVTCLIVAIVCAVLTMTSSRPTVSQEFAPKSTTTSRSLQTTLDSTQTTTTTCYISPVDFEGLQKVNSDIYAWIQIPGTPVDYPVVQSATDDSFYLDHDADGQYTSKGAIFSESAYNSTSFEDPVTVLYGHNMATGEMFGEFQAVYWDRDFLLENDEIIVYLPDRELHFEIFAATPYSRMHLLYYYKTDKKAGFEALIDDLFASRNLSAVFVEERKPKFGDQVLVLSTCLSGDNRYRYLVVGVCKA